MPCLPLKVGYTQVLKNLNKIWHYSLHRNKCNEEACCNKQHQPSTVRRAHVPKFILLIFCRKTKMKLN